MQSSPCTYGIGHSTVSDVGVELEKSYCQCAETRRNGRVLKCWLGDITSSCALPLVCPFPDNIYGGEFRKGESVYA